MISTTPERSGERRDAVTIDRGLANERLIDRMMLTLASGVMALVLAISVSFHVAGSVRLAPHFYVASVSYLAVAIVCAWIAPRLTTMRDLERLRWAALIIAAAAMLSMSYFLGGASWIGAQPLFFLMFGCTFTPNHWRALIIATAGIGGFVALAALEGTGVLPHQDPLGGALDPLRGAQLAATVAYTSVALALFCVMSGVISVLLILQRDVLSTTTADLEASKRELEGLNADLGDRVAEKTRELEERYRELHVMAEIGKIVNQSLDIDNVYLAFMDEVRKLVPFDQAAIAVFAPDRTTVRLLRGIVEQGAVSGTSFTLPTDRALSAQRTAQIVEDFSKEDEAWVERDYLLRNGLACGATVPIFSHEVQIGAFNVASKAPRTYDARLLSLLERAVEPLALAMENARLYDEMRAIADTDGLTGLPNRRSLERAIEHEIARAVRHGDRCSVLVMDIDNFKSFNDSLGHHAGDEMLVRFAAMLRETCRETDVVGRQSGDEFTVILPETSSEEAFALAQRIHDAMKRSGWQYPGESGAPVTTSIGVATYPHDGENSEAMLSQADSAMYVAKAAGGGQTRLSSDVVKRKAA